MGRSKGCETTAYPGDDLFCRTNKHRARGRRDERGLSKLPRSIQTLCPSAYPLPVSHGHTAAHYGNAVEADWKGGECKVSGSGRAVMPRGSVMSEPSAHLARISARSPLSLLPPAVPVRVMAGSVRLLVGRDPDVNALLGPQGAHSTHSQCGRGYCRLRRQGTIKQQALAARGQFLCEPARTPVGHRRFRSSRSCSVVIRKALTGAAA